MSQQAQSRLPNARGNTSFPTPLPMSSTQYASSIVSTQVTDGGSEVGDDVHMDGLGGGIRPGTAASTEPYRPGSALSSQTRPSTRAPPSRREMAMPGTMNAMRSAGPFGSSTGSVASSSRPVSAVSRSSKSHVPSLASHAFFHPMSSQRLQAQRQARQPKAQALSLNEDPKRSPLSTNRNSLITDIAERQDAAPYNDLGPPPLSRGTDYTERDDGTVDTAGFVGGARNRNLSESERPLQQSVHEQSATVNGSTTYRQSRLFGNGLRHTSGSSGKEKAAGEELDSPSNQQAVTDSVDLSAGRNYQHFMGNTIFFFGGRMQNTKERPVNILSGLLVFVPSILFLIFSGPYLAHNASPAVPFFFAYLSFVCISSFAHASVTNPGIIPRHLHSPPAATSQDPLAIPPPLTQWTMIKAADDASAAMELPTKYCRTCDIWRPPRCHHCRVCDNCIETQDHHCVWINNCVGRRNYRYFFAFVSTGTLLGIFLMFGSLGHCLRYATSNHISFAESVNHNRVPFAMFFYGILATPYPACLWGYHLWLLARGETTREYLNSHKFLKKDRHRPFSQNSFFKNWIIALVRPRPPGYLRFKETYVVGDQRYRPNRSPKAGLIAQGASDGGTVELGVVKKGPML